MQNRFNLYASMKFCNSCSIEEFRRVLLCIYTPLCTCLYQKRQYGDSFLLVIDRKLLMWCLEGKKVRSTLSVNWGNCLEVTYIGIMEGKQKNKQTHEQNPDYAYVQVIGTGITTNLIGL